MGEAPRRAGYLAQAWLVVVLALLYGGGLAAVETLVGGRIAENRSQETYAAIPDLVPGADPKQTVELLLVGDDGRETKVYQALGLAGEHLGWVVPASGQGFGGAIEVLVGLDAELGTITGLYVLEQRETPGLGDHIRGDAFRSQFRGRPAEVPLSVVKLEAEAEHEIRAITGATISSESVANIVNQALANLRGPLARQAGGGG